MFFVWERWQLSCWAAISWSRPSRRRGWGQLKESMPEVTTALIGAAVVPITRRWPGSQLDLVSRSKPGEGHHPSQPDALAPGAQHSPSGGLPCTTFSLAANTINYLLLQLIPTSLPPQEELPEQLAFSLSPGAEGDCPHLLRRQHSGWGTHRRLARLCYNSTGGRQGTWIPAWYQCCHGPKYTYQAWKSGLLYQIWPTRFTPFGYPQELGEPALGLMFLGKGLTEKYL